PSSLRCIHPKQNRALTSREGARLQSFPDSFQFYGSKTQVNIQIGNAVPPLLSIALADSVKRFFLNNF
ncbi:DNA cytosine methyltransferase, partial [Streptococcus suis]